MARRAQPEYALHVAMADYFRVVLAPDVVWSYIAHGVPGNAIRGMRWKRAGLRPGLGDFFLSWRRSQDYEWATGQLQVAWLEAKALKGRQSPEQIQFQADCLRIGHHYDVVHSLDETEAALVRYQAPIRTNVDVRKLARLT